MSVALKEEKKKKGRKKNRGVVRQQQHELAVKEHKGGKGDLACLTLNLLSNSSFLAAHACVRARGQALFFFVRYLTKSKISRRSCKEAFVSVCVCVCARLEPSAPLHS